MTDTDTGELRNVRLPAATQVYENLHSVLGGLIFTILAWALAYPLLSPGWGLSVALTVTLFAILGIFVDIVRNNFQQRNFTLSVLHREMNMVRGRYLTTSLTVIPGAVLSVDVHTGPVLRRLGLARLRLNGVANLPQIPPLASADARVVQHLMIQQMDTSPLIDREV